MMTSQSVDGLLGKTTRSLLLSFPPMSLFRRILRLLFRPRRLLDEWNVFLDSCLFQWKFRFLREGAERADPSRKVLVISLSHHPAYPKIESMLLKSLQLKGCTPVVLTERSCKRVLPYFKTFGINEVLFFDDFLARAKDPHDEETLELLFTNPTFHSLVSFVQNGIGIGRHAFSAVVRKLRNKGVSFLDPEVQVLLRRMFGEALCAARAGDLLFREHMFEAVIFSHEKGYTPYGDLFDSAINAGCNVVSVAHSQRPDAYILKRYGKHNRTLHHSSLSQKSWDAVKAMPWSTAMEEGLMNTLKESYETGTWFHRNVYLSEKKIAPPDTLRSQLKIDRAKKTVTVFSHILWDATFFFGESLFDDYEQWLVETVRAACQNDKVNWIIKLHPDYTWKMHDIPDEKTRDVLAIAANIGPLPPHVQVVPPATPFSTYSFFQCSDYAITVRGTVGIEAPCFGIPTFTAGTGRYSGLGLTIDSTSREEYVKRLLSIEETPAMSDEQRTLARRHAYALFMMRPLPFTLFQLVRADSNHMGKGLDHNTIIRARALKEVEQDPALTAFAEWVLHARDDDYLAPPTRSYTAVVTPSAASAL